VIDIMTTIPQRWKLLIVGASGFIGMKLAERAAQDCQVWGTYKARGSRLAPVSEALSRVSWQQLDVADVATARGLLADVRPDVVVHLAATAAVEQADKQEEVYGVNMDGTVNMVRACEAIGAFLIFFSTDYVFDGLAGPYAEDAVPTPINAYGRQKLAAEEIVRKSAVPHLIVRTSMVYGWPALHHHLNFAATVIHRLRQGQPFTAYTDMIRTPIYVGDLVDVLVQFIKRQATGLYHVGSKNAISMYEFALSIGDVFGLGRSLIVAATSVPHGSVSRPRRCGLRTDKASGDFGIRFPTTLEGLHRMKEQEPSYG